MLAWLTTSAASVYNYTLMLLGTSLEAFPSNPISIEKNGTLFLDRLCMCREFPTPQSHMADMVNKSQCDGIGFHDRWRVTTNISHPSAHVEGPEVVFGGVHALVFVSIDVAPQEMVVAFRHQEGDGLTDSDMWEAMGLWGRNFVQLQAPSTVATGSIIDYGARALQSLIFGTRHVANVDYLPQAGAFVDALVHYHALTTPPTFTGYSMGGALAQLLAVHTSSSAVVFASNGILDILGLYHMLPASSLLPQNLVNVLHPRDLVPKMDCQIGTVVVDDASVGPDDVDTLHHAFVYGNVAWKQLHTALAVTHGRAWSQANGFCIDNALANGPDFAVDSLAQVTVTQGLATFLLGLIVVVLLQSCSRARAP
ncbi:Aste57867_19956 [Aphanomyces stellatus]|uniref:Aste57867_19956 protein n=1 Tax=Aphanomyces stellatus TaxID=120398 RepID=A0A485LDZ2_9STRA|nr:hypothetical protein As57867_019890 [Aphanomyces stellatus]VFT96653.1 Aste57867_19956 [Aphanomyces stellatus]